MISIPTRLRAHEYPHVRSIETQTLDAILRIEELLEKLVEAHYSELPAPRNADGSIMDLEDVIGAISPSTTAFMESIQKPVPPKRKNPRQL